MKISIVGSTKPGFKLNKNEALNFGGKSAGICYLPGSFEDLFNEPEEKTVRRANMTLNSGHHSVFDHTTYNLVLERVPKILAMILNNEKMYTTSEKSARYTKMQPSEEEEAFYEKWLGIFYDEIAKMYPEIEEKRAKKLAQENARNLISIFTPATTMEYSVSLRQLNYIVHWFEEYIKNEEDNAFNLKLKPVMQNFIDEVSSLVVPELNTAVKGRKLSIFDERQDRKEEFGENYCTTYEGSFAMFAQAERHRTIDYKIKLLDNFKCVVPEIIENNNELKSMWIEDMTSLKDMYPQGMVIKICERGTAEDFILKCQERVCGAAQLEIMRNTVNTLQKYIENTKDTNAEVYNYLLPYSKGARCTYPGFKCTSPCIWGAKNAFTRKV